MTPGQVAYESYISEPFQNVPFPLPKWEEQSKEIQAAWERVAVTMMSYGRFDTQKEYEQQAS